MNQRRVPGRKSFRKAEVGTRRQPQGGLTKPHQMIPKVTPRGDPSHLIQRSGAKFVDPRRTHHARSRHILTPGEARRVYRAVRMPRRHRTQSAALDTAGTG